MTRRSYFLLFVVLLACIQILITYFNPADVKISFGQTNKKDSIRPNRDRRAPLENTSSIYDDFHLSPVDIEVNGHNMTFNKKAGTRDPEKLRIHLVFHSHVDPGWLQTFDDYHRFSTKSIISSAVEALDKYKDLKFIWSEICFLERWYQEATEEQKEAIKRHVTSGRLEITGGSWVMPDEAIPLFYPVIESMIEGHQFVLDNFKIRPVTSWSVDPFGHGAGMPHLLHKAGIDNLVVGRIHDHLKEYMRKRQSLRWQWNEMYSNDPSTGPRVHCLPFTVYYTFDACFDKKVCECYHVGPSRIFSCPTQLMVANMTESQLDFQATRFLTEIRKVQKLYGTVDHMVPIGEDFAFKMMEDFDEMYLGFKSMMEYFKRHPELNVEMKFSTATEFFDSIKDDQLESLRGDFFPYVVDRDKASPWWNGYYSHRPVVKRLERVLQANLRGLDLLIHLENDLKFDNKVIKEAKRNLAIFQHHDGITGTSKIHVMNDFEKRMLSAQDTYVASIGHLFKSYDQTVVTKKNGSDLHGTVAINGKETAHVSVINVNTFKFSDVITVYTPTEVIVSQGHKELSTQCQQMEGGVYMVSWVADMPAMSSTSFKLIPGTPPKMENVQQLLEFDQKKMAFFNVYGKKKAFRVSLHTIADYGGAYVFDPPGDAKANEVKVKEVKEEIGPVLHRRIITFEGSQLVLFVTTTSEASDGISIECQTDVSDGQSLMIHVDTDIDTNEFHTDINGLFHVKRVHQQDFENRALPYQANFFPVASSVFIQDKQWRMTVISGQSMAVSNGNTRGGLHFLVDRRLRSSDTKGLDSGDAYDGRSALVKYKILFEERQPQVVDSGSSTSPALSVHATKHWHNELYPPVLLTSTKSGIDKKYLDFKWPCNIQIISWRPISKEESLLVLRKVVFDKTIPSSEPCDQSMDGIIGMLNKKYKTLKHTSLTGTADKQQQVTVESLQQHLNKPYDVTTIKLIR